MLNLLSLTTTTTKTTTKMKTKEMRMMMMMLETVDAEHSDAAAYSVPLGFLVHQNDQATHRRGSCHSCPAVTICRRNREILLMRTMMMREEKYVKES